MLSVLLNSDSLRLDRLNVLNFGPCRVLRKTVFINGTQLIDELVVQVTHSGTLTLSCCGIKLECSNMWLLLD